MNIISVDLPWNPATQGRIALAIADLNGSVEVISANNDEEMLQIIRDNEERNSLILLDIPIEGCKELENTQGKRFRSVDKALSHQGIGLFPSHRAGNRGKALKEYLEKQSKNIIVQEIYPYAAYKLLWYVQEKGKLINLADNDFAYLLDEEFKRQWPPIYKRAKKKNERLEATQFLYRLLINNNIGLSFRPFLSYPDITSNLDELSDKYDACLGAIVGLCCVRRNRYACVAGCQNEGEILLLADHWLQAELQKEIKVRNAQEEYII